MAPPDSALFRPFGAVLSIRASWPVFKSGWKRLPRCLDPPCFLEFRRPRKRLICGTVEILFAAVLKFAVIPGSGFSVGTRAHVRASSIADHPGSLAHWQTFEEDPVERTTNLFSATSLATACARLTCLCTLARHTSRTAVISAGSSRTFSASPRFWFLASGSACHTTFASHVIASTRSLSRLATCSPGSVTCAPG